MNEYSIEEKTGDTHSKFRAVQYSIRTVLTMLKKVWFDVFVDLINSNVYKSYQFLGDVYNFKSLEDFIRSKDGLNADPISLYTAIQFVKVFAETGAAKVDTATINHLLEKLKEYGLSLNSDPLPNIPYDSPNPEELLPESTPIEKLWFVRTGATISEYFSNLWFQNFINTIDSGWYKSYEFLGDTYTFENLEDFIRSEDALNTNPNTLYNFILACAAYPKTANAAKQLLLKFDECKFSPQVR